MVSQCAVPSGAHHGQQVGQHVAGGALQLLPGRLAGQGAELFAVLAGGGEDLVRVGRVGQERPHRGGVVGDAVQVAHAPVLVAHRQRGGVEPFLVGVAARGSPRTRCGCRTSARTVPSGCRGTG